MNAPAFFLVVRFWVAPQAESQVMRWLDYEANAALREKFARERALFEKHMRIERFAGQVA